MKFIPLLLLALALPVSARIGESKERLSARYGPPTETKDNSMVYCKNGYVVKVSIIDDKCHWIRFARDVAGGIEGPLPADQLSGLFTSNQDGLQWTRATDGSFRSSDGQRQAIVADGTLVIQTITYKQAEKKTAQEGEVADPKKAPLRISGPAPTRVGIMAKTASAGAGRDKKWETWWGSYDKEIFRDRVVTISLRASTGGSAIVETHWIGEEIEKNSGNKVVDVGREAVVIPGGEPVSLEMGSLFVENDTKYAALGVREKSGVRYAGWVVRVVDGAGNVLAVQGSRPPLVALVK